MSEHEAMEAIQSVCRWRPTVCAKLATFFQKTSDLLNATGFEAVRQIGKCFQVPDFFKCNFVRIR